MEINIHFIKIPYELIPYHTQEFVIQFPERVNTHAHNISNRSSGALSVRADVTGKAWYLPQVCMCILYYSILYSANNPFQLKEANNFLQRAFQEIDGE